MKTVIQSIIVFGGLAIMSSPLSAQNVPDQTPARKPGLWDMVTTGTVGPNQLKAIKKYCLDADADQALRQLHVLRMQLEVIYHDINCRAPEIAANRNVITGEMVCRTNSQEDSEAAGKDFHWKATFASDSDVVLEERSTPRDVMLLLEIATTERQRWVGQCPAGMKPGDSLDLGFTYNSDAWPNQANADNIYASVERLEKALDEGKMMNERLGPM